jgi:hypothetical protein
LLEAGDEAQGGRLAASRGTEQRDDLAARDHQRRIIHGRMVAEPLHDVAQMEPGRRHPR